MSTRWYRIAIVVWAFLYAWWSTLPWSIHKQGAIVRAAMEHSGRGAIIPPSDTIANALLLATVIAAGGLFFFRAWARVLLVVTTAGSVALSPFLGVGVSGPVDGTIGFLMTLLTGGLIAVVFWSPLAGRFVAANDPEEIERFDVASLVAVYEAADPTTASAIRSLLTSAGIEYVIAGGGRFLVRSSDAAFAKDVIELGFETPPEPAPN